MTRGERNCAWIEAHCRIPEGKFVGQPVRLRAWQREIVLGIYDNAIPTRLALISFGRKNAKTTLAALLLLLHTAGPEARPNSQLFSAAQSKEQAAVLFALAAKIVRMSPDLLAVMRIRDHEKQLACPELGSLYRALSAEAATAYGLSPVFVVHDELGQVRGPRSPLFEALETAAGAQESPLSIVISTQAPTNADLLSVLIDDAKTKADPATRLWLWTADESLDPFSDEALQAANPALGDFLSYAEVRRQAETARRMPAREAAFRNLVLNQRVEATNPFVSPSVWQANGGAVDLEAFENGPVWIGLDLSARLDLTALVAVAPSSEGWHVLPTFYAPEDGLSERAARDRVPYDVWARDGFLELTPGRTVDYDFVAAKLAELCARWPVAEVPFDRWNVKHLEAALDRIGALGTVPLVEFGQGFASMSPALAALEAELVNARVRHGGHVVLTWNAANAVVTSDPAGNRKLDKSKATGRIDGLVALAMAIGRAAGGDNVTSAYESEGLTIL